MGGWSRQRIDEGKFLEKLRGLGPPSSVVLCGPELLLRDAVLREMERTVLSGGGEERFNREVYSARETPLSELAAGLRMVGLFADARLIVLQDLERYGRAAKADREDLWAWLEQPSPGIHLVLVSEKPLWELERANEFTRGTLERAQSVVRLDHPTLERAVELVRTAAERRHQLDLPLPCAQRLVEAVGPDLLALAHELDRLALRLGPGARVEAAMLDDWLRAGTVGGIEDLEGALLERDTVRALRTWDRIRSSFSAPAVTWMLASRQLDARWGRRSGRSDASPGAVSRLLRECYCLERGIKAGEIPSSLQEVAWEEVILRLGARTR
jgi:DNA polymerase III delta subunit